MTSKPEEIAARCLRAILAPISVGAAIEDSDDFSHFQSAMQFFIPSMLEEEYPWWWYESLDAFRFAVARKVGPEEAEFIGLCLLISDQTWTPLRLRLRIAPQSDNIEWLVCRLGESGTGAGGMVRTPYGSSREQTRLLNSVMDRLESIAWAYTITRGASPPAASLGLSEIITINQLVRGRIDLTGFTNWYEQLSPSQQYDLIITLFEFAHQAGVDEKVWEEALSAGNMTSIIELTQQSKSFHNYELGIHDWNGFYRWLQELSESDKSKVLTIGVYLFGAAEGKIFSKERKKWCNHWWHRDLLDPRVVEDILSDPKFYLTSMKDDDKVKKSG